MCSWRACAIALCACTSVTESPAPDPTVSLDETVFKCNVEPILVRQCSYLACHGNPQSALRVYSPGKLRATTPANVDDEDAAVTDAEHHANFLNAAGLSFGLASVDDNWLLRKPLPSADGGFEHVGGAIYIGTNDTQYVAIHDWLTNKGACK